MRYFKFAVIGLLVLFILFTIIGLLMPSSVTVMRSVDVNAPADSIKFYTNDLAHWRYWINGADTANYKQLTVNSSAKNSKIILGAYTITIIESDPKYITAIWKSENNEQLSRLQLYSNSSSGITNINWSFQQQLKWYPWERLTAMLRDKVFGPSMEVSLNKLKTVCEK